MDNPISWGILILIVIIGLIKFMNRIEKEIDERRIEEEKYWKDHSTYK